MLGSSLLLLTPAIIIVVFNGTTTSFQREEDYKEKHFSFYYIGHCAKTNYEAIYSTEVELRVEPEA